MRFQTILTLVVTFLVIVISCNENGGQHKVENEKTGNARIKFDTVFFDFGSLKQGEKVAHTFYFENTGNIDLIIKDVVPGCGCTVPKYSKEPLAPGEKGNVEVVFNTSGRQGAQMKTVQVKSNAVNSSITLTFKANIIVPK